MLILAVLRSVRCQAVCTWNSPPVFPGARFRVLGAAGGPDLDRARAAGTTMAWGLGVVVLRTEQWEGAQKEGASLWAG